MEHNLNNSDSNHTPASAALLVMAWILESFRSMNLSEAMSMLFQALSLLSVLLIVIINLPKAILVLRSLFPKREVEQEKVPEANRIERTDDTHHPKKEEN